MPRLFTGVEIPPDVGQALSTLRGGLPGARWIDPENYHLTLRFIGDVDDNIAHEVASMLGRVKRGAFELYMEGLTSFGGRKPRAVVASVVPAQALLDVQAEHERLMQRIGLEPEGRRISFGPRLFSYVALPGLTLRVVLVAGVRRRWAVRSRGGLSAQQLTSCRIEQPGLYVEDDSRDAMGIGDHLTYQRQQGETRGIDFSDHAAEIELEIGFKLAGQLLHTPVVGETMHAQHFDPTIA